ncbi:hypothetical protein IT415_00500 [bacterium]|nr:hypothetical protein [bacterium]
MEIKRIDARHIELTLGRKAVAIGPEGGRSGDVVLYTQIPKQDVAMRPGVFFEPGEYEVQGIMVDGVKSDDGLVSYHIVQDGIMIAAVALRTVAALTDEVIEYLQPSQVLCIWLEEGKASDLADLLAKLEASIVVPVGLPFESGELEAVVKMPQESTEQIKISSKDISFDQPKLYILQ